MSSLARFPVDDLTLDNYDVALTDMNPIRLAEEIAPLLGVEYLGPAEPPTDFIKRWPLKGIFTGGPRRRMLVNAPVQLRDKCINVVFLLDTGAPLTYVATEALEALGLKDAISSEVHVLINGVPRFVAPVPGNSHFKGVSLLGADFVEDVDVIIKCARGSRTFTLHVGEEAVPAALR